MRDVRGRGREHSRRPPRRARAPCPDLPAPPGRRRAPTRKSRAPRDRRPWRATQACAAVVGAHEEFYARKLGAHQVDDAVGGGALVDADRDQPHLGGDRGAQHVQARAVAVIDLEAEAARMVIISGSLSMVKTSISFGQQALRHDLAEAAEADDQRRAGTPSRLSGSGSGASRPATSPYR